MSLLILFIFNLAMAQNHGHPGGGGPFPELQKCYEHLSDTEELEYKFLTSIGYTPSALIQKQEETFLNFLIIANAQIIMNQVNKIKLEENSCKKNTQARTVFSTQKEKAMLKKIHTIWSKNKIPPCNAVFNKRLDMIGSLEFLIDNYEVYRN